MKRCMRNIVALFVAALAGCAAGPDFRRPASPAAASYAGKDFPAETAAAPSAGGAAQRFVEGEKIPAQWWELFRSKPLDNLIRQAFADNPSLSAAEARLRIAEQNRRAQFGALFPQVSGSASASRQKSSGASFGQPQLDISPFNLYNASIGVTYALDLFGGTRRELEALQAEIDYRRYQREGAWLAIAANIVTTAVREADLRARIAATRDIASAEEMQLGLVERRHQLGGASLPDVLAQKAQLAQTRAALPELEKQLAQARHRLALLAGRYPEHAATLPEFALDGMNLPQELPLSLPSSMARRRPDIRAAEEVLHAASARIGVATANLYPQITLTGNMGSLATRPQDLFGSGSSIWSVGAGLLQPIFRGGELTAKRRAAIAAYDEAAAQYRETVLLAFQNVADALRALEKDAQTLKAQAGAEAAARESLELARRQFELGAVGYLTLLNAERQHRQAVIELVQARAARLSDTAALFQALGGGWWNGEPESGADKISRNGRISP
ncbi:MAG: efflux transporter outer membrane subunit [Deltaproteobacteria bacterium]|nr:efflux transporter outer membrane subunit [Deltaproteobacteria bacterium]